MKNNSFILVLLLMICVLPATGQDADGFTIFYYESGQKSSEGFLINGKPDGFWKTYHENGIIKSEGNRVNFMLDSIWNFYNDTGKVVMQITYGMGKKNGIRRTFHEDEVIEENFVDDVKQGFTYYYYPNGKLKEEVYFEEGLEEGTGRQYALSDGRVIKLKYYKKGFVYDIENINRMDKAGLRQGPWKYFYENGNVRVEGEYKNGLEHGYFKEYTEDGNLISTSKFVDGILQEDVSELAKLDIKREYYPDGKVKIMASFKDGVAEGVRREYSEEGDIIKGFVFIKGNVVGEGITNDEGFRDGPWKEYYFSGALKAEGMYDKGKRSGEWKFYHPNGEIEQTGKYNKEGKEDGTWTWYYPEGLLQREETYFNGMRDGYSVEYDENGIVVAEGEYIEDSREGFWKLNYGDHREEGAYFNDMRSGEWKHFYNEGTLSFEGNFIDDNPNGKHTWYWPSGFKKTEGTYIMGLKTGEWVKYNADGTPFITFYYENGAESKVDGVKFNIFDEDK